MVVLCIIIGIAMGGHIAIHTVFTFRFNSICLIMIFKVDHLRQENNYTPCSSSFENTELTNCSTNELETLHVRRFPFNLVHRHIIFHFLDDDYQS